MLVKDSCGNELLTFSFPQFVCAAPCIEVTECMMRVGMFSRRVLVKDSGGIEPLTFSFLRFACAAAAFSPFLPEAVRDETGTLLPAGLELGLWTSAGYLTQARFPRFFPFLDRFAYFPFVELQAAHGHVCVPQVFCMRRSASGCSAHCS